MNKIVAHVDQKINIGKMQGEVYLIFKVIPAEAGIHNKKFVKEHGFPPARE